MEPAFSESARLRMSRPDPLAARARRASWLEEIVTHEVGHQVSHDNNDQLLKQFSAAAGWTEAGLPRSHLPRNSRWDYARTNSHEHFAEMYSSAVNSPTRLYDEFRASPGQDLREAQRDLRHLKREGSDAETILRARAKATRAREVAASREAQWRVMREQVFGVNDAIVAQRAAALRTQGELGEESARAFTHEARKVMTPHQLDALFRRYQKSPGREP